jgi:hypothetical protein
MYTERKIEAFLIISIIQPIKGDHLYQLHA